MSFKEAVKKEVDVIVHGQTIRFMLMKYAVLLLSVFLLFSWKGWRTVGIVFAILFAVSIMAHFFFRWKTKGWTQTWGLYKVNDNKF
ncbi:MAG: hypothetical protein KW793_04800 [Candidatus Doudnabacteria bacterium]|nr:hypothetical protein [Candidatus Doudnabacteria bacterium]